MSDLLKRTLASHPVGGQAAAQVVEVPLEQLEWMASKVRQEHSQLDLSLQGSQWLLDRGTGSPPRDAKRRRGKAARPRHQSGVAAPVPRAHHPDDTAAVHRSSPRPDDVREGIQSRRREGECGRGASRSTDVRNRAAQVQTRRGARGKSRRREACSGRGGAGRGAGQPGKGREEAPHRRKRPRVQPQGVPGRVQRALAAQPGARGA